MLSVGRQPSTGTGPNLKKDNLIKIGFEQLASLSSMYALQILVYIEKTYDLNVWSQVAKQGFGYTTLSRISLSSCENETPTFTDFVEAKKTEFMFDLQEEVVIGPTRKHKLLQVTELIWLAYHSKTAIVSLFLMP
jgi:hypothetical protein